MLFRVSSISKTAQLLLEACRPPVCRAPVDRTCLPCDQLPGDRPVPPCRVRREASTRSGGAPDRVQGSVRIRSERGSTVLKYRAATRERRTPGRGVLRSRVAACTCEFLDTRSGRDLAFHCYRSLRPRTRPASCSGPGTAARGEAWVRGGTSCPPACTRQRDGSGHGCPAASNKRFERATSATLTRTALIAAQTHHVLRTR